MINTDYALVVTGANGNLASHFNRKVLQQGYNLILLYHNNRQRLDELLMECASRIRLIRTDFASADDLKRQFADVFTETGWIPRGLFHTTTARSSDFQPLADSPEATWEYVIDVNIKGTFRLLKALIPYFRKYNYGKIVLMGSNVSRIGLPRGSAYSLSKAAMGNLSRCLATEEGHNNIFINTISPGPIKMDDSHFSESYRKFREEYYKERIREIPLQRCASVEDIFGLAWFLLSENNSYITGEEFYITGGKL
ncbi:MAG: SDR family oxidoreductase [Candidatus Cloacimonetes bacterium]|nr:SDR family oxidoreductase [Candidatus Cloacimonadota bacterium]